MTPAIRQLLEEVRHLFLSRGMTEEENRFYLDICAELDPIERAERVAYSSPMTEREEREEAEYLTVLSRSGR